MKESNYQTETMSLDSPSTGSHFESSISPTSSYSDPRDHRNDNTQEARKFPREKKGATSAGPTDLNERTKRKTRQSEKVKANQFEANSSTARTHRIAKKKWLDKGRSAYKVQNTKRKLEPEAAAISQGVEGGYDGSHGPR